MFFVVTERHNKLQFPSKFHLCSVYTSGPDGFLRGRDDFFQTAYQPISVHHLSLPDNELCCYTTEARLIGDEPRNPKSRLINLLPSYTKFEQILFQNYKAMQYETTTIPTGNARKVKQVKKYQFRKVTKRKCCIIINKLKLRKYLEIFGLRDLSCGFAFERNASASLQNIQYSLFMQNPNQGIRV